MGRSEQSIEVGQAGLQHSVAQARHCTTPRGAVYMGYHEIGTPRVVLVIILPLCMFLWKARESMGRTLQEPEWSF